MSLKLTFIVATLLLGPLSALGAADGAKRIELGPAETVLADKALGLRYFPDGRLAVGRTRPDCRVLLAAGVSSFLLEGPAMGTFTKASKVLDKGEPGEFDNGYAGINAAVRAKPGELLAFYHAEDQEGMKTVGHGIPGFYGRVALAVSRDDGASFEKRGPVLSGRFAKDATGPGDQGVGEPWVLAEPRGEFLYAYYTSHERVDGRGVQICMARCPVADATRADAWKKFHAGGFTEPGLGGKDTPVFTSGLSQADAVFPHVVFVPGLRQFMMTFCLNVWREADNPKRSGIYAAFSHDGIHWLREPMQQLWKVPVVPAIGRELAWHPTYIPDGDGGMHGWLYYGYSESWGHPPSHKPHYLMRRRMTFVAGNP
ncbi:MAG: hypothetical protein N2689_15140 [Verrucomicrobiae bacterium]|nr:hypothetical protein [Verrucomicrobiae bacterium]